jgi:RNA polymerase II subunit A small phosphatase-like protein
VDINSPRAKTKQQWGADETDSSAAVAGLMTQVSREDANKQMAGMQDDDTERNIKTATDAPSGICACFSCLWSCCSGPQSPASVEMNDNSQNSTSANNNLITEVKKTEGSDATLLGNNETTRENSVSSTDYSFKLLPPLEPRFKGKKCLVLDLDETLVHSSFKPIPKPDFIIPVEIDKVVHHVYVLKRPYVDEFLLRASKCYEIVIFTASLSKYADPLLDKLDIHNVISHRLFRESCVIHGTAYVKDMKRVGRPLKDTIIVDNSPPSYMFQPCNAVPCASWFDDKSDTQLLDFCPVIETTMKDIDDVRCLLDANNKSFRWLCAQANQPLSNYTVRNDKRNRQQM